MGKIKALALISGGLDSALSAKLVQSQGIEVLGVHFLSFFSKYNLEDFEDSPAYWSAREIGIEIEARELGEEFLEVVKNPKFGYGKAMNPCIDCRILELKKAVEILKEKRTQFIITGEVVGQRPMSQRREMLKLIDKESGLSGMVLRPLSAKILPLTIAEERGWVERDKLYGIAGRSRKVQFELAQQFALKAFSTPAGGCLLTEEGFGKKVSDLIKHQPNFGGSEVALLKLGRHFRISPKAKLVVGKNDKENKKLIALAQKGDWLIHTDNLPGPTGLIRGEFGDQELNLAGRLIAFYVHKGDSPEVPLILIKVEDEKIERTKAIALSRGDLERLRI